MIPINELKRGYELYKDEYEEKALSVLRSGWYILGNEVKEFENEFAQGLIEESKGAVSDDFRLYAAGVDNGLNAIHLGLLAGGIKEGDEIIVQANGYIATMLGIMQCGAKPVFVEPDEYYQLDADNIEAAITDKTSAVLVTHLYGMCTRMDRVIEICKKHDLMLFEDCAQAHFSKYNGKCAGLYGKAAFFSFFPTKNLGAFGDGGCVVSGDENIINKVKVLRNYGSDYRYHNIEIGYNSRLDELQAGLLRVKLKHMKELIANRNEIAKKYLAGIKNPIVELPQIAEECNHIWYQFVVRLPKERRDEFCAYMKENDVATDISWKTPPYLQPAIKDFYGYSEGAYPQTEDLCAKIVSLPMMDYLSDEEIRKVIDTVNGFK